MLTVMLMYGEGTGYAVTGVIGLLIYGLCAKFEGGGGAVQVPRAKQSPPEEVRGACWCAGT